MNAHCAAKCLRKGRQIATAFAIITAGLLTPLADQAHAQQKEGWKPLEEYAFEGLDKRLAVDLKGIEVVEALKFLAEEGGLNIAASDQVKGTVHLLLQDVSVGSALETVLALNDLAYVVKDNIIHVMAEQEFTARYGIPFYETREARTYQLKYADPSSVAKMLQNVKSERGEIVYNDDTGTLILRDIPGKLQEMEKIVEQTEIPTIKRVKPTKTRTYKLQYAEIEDIKAEINEVLTKDMGSARYDKRTGTIIVSDLPHKLDMIDQVVGAFDKKSPEVLIEARIVQVSLSDKYELGIDWAELAKWSLRGVEIIEQDIDLRDAGLSLMTTESMNQNLILDALDQFGDTHLLSDPRLTVQDGNEATLEVVTSEAYEAGTSEVDSGGVTTSFRNFEFVDVGVSLLVIPKINDERFINMLIKPEVSSVVSWFGGETGPADPRSAGSVPVVKRSTAETTVTVKDGVTIMIAGLIDETVTTNVSKFPFLGDVYGLGRLFQHHAKTTERRETIIFLTPRIVSGEKNLNVEKYSQKKLKGFRE